MRDVLHYNIDIRNKTILRNEGKYRLWTESLAPAIGEVYDIRTLASHSLTGKYDLYGYTHSEGSTFADKIDNANFGNVSEKEPYTNEIDKVNRLRWKGDYEDYSEYIREVFGTNAASGSLVSSNFTVGDWNWATLPTSLSSLLSTTVGAGIGESFTLGTFHYTDPFSAVNGSIITNPNNTGKDTKLGLIGNNLYGVNMKKASLYGDAFGSYGKYLTPNLALVYGNNSNTFEKLGDVLAINQATGRVPDLAAANDATITEYARNVAATNGGKIYLDENLLYYTFYKPDEPYVSYLANDKRGRGRFTDINDFSFNASQAVIGDTTEKSHNFYRQNEGDSEGAAGNIEEADTPYENNISIKAEEGNKKTLLTKTAQLYAEHKIATLMGRFHTTESDDGITFGPSEIDSANDPRYGNSHGRNLLRAAKERAANFNGYDNPYCRTWTYHNQYGKVRDLIRPFINEDGGAYTISEVQNKISHNYRSHKYSSDGTDTLNGGDYLANNTVLDSNGFVNITPKKGDDRRSIKNCMFAIENLAWRDVHKINKGSESNISEEQTGPLGGRIMWFPPYDLNFQESVNVDWQSNSFLGRGEKMYTYSNTDRTGTLSFTLLIDHPAVVNSYPYMKKKNPTEDYEGNLLRYFAGCAPYEDTANFDEYEEGIESPKQVDVANKVETKDTPDEGAQTMKFYVFFPNNYSGNMSATDGTYVKGQTGDPKDEDWALYLLGGSNVGLGDDKRGYEMFDGEWLTSTDYLNNENNYIESCASTADGKECQAVLSTANDKPKDYAKRKYGYRVDYDLRQRNLKIIDSKKINNYQDSACFKLNSDVEVVAAQDEFKDATCSFLDFMYAFYTTDTNGKGSISTIDDEGMMPSTTQVFATKLYNQLTSKGKENVKTLKDLLSDYKDRIVSVTVRGGATNQDPNNSNKLALRRRGCLKSLFSSAYFKNGLDVKDGDTQVVEIKNSIKWDDNTIEAKKGRFAAVEITYNPVKVEETNPAAADVEKKVDEAKAVRTVVPKLRYETEGEYFKRIETDDPMVYKWFTEKFEHFNPAFHSISPEGFNARLTFLHQCTRQGHTIEAVNEGEETGIRAAGNLAFGRMPVCVLRIGDFIYNRILITSMSISYDQGGGMQWDLNPEGIGVQPMYAKISLGIVILGGASLEGPINRLQNAVSFDFYANAGVYDNRADRAHTERSNVAVTDTGIWGEDSINESNGFFKDEQGNLKRSYETQGTDGTKITTTENAVIGSGYKTVYDHIFTTYPSNGKG